VNRTESRRLRHNKYAGPPGQRQIGTQLTHLAEYRETQPIVVPGVNLSRYSSAHLTNSITAAVSAGTPVYDALVAEFRMALRAIPGDRATEEMYVGALLSGLDRRIERPSRGVVMPRQLPRHRAASDALHGAV
jgi:hypothetical protein